MVKERREGSKIPASYVCPVCDTVYKTKKEAESCYRYNFEQFKKGDLVLFSGIPYAIRYDLENGDDACFVIDKHVPLAKAMGCYNTKKQSWAPLYNNFCKRRPIERFDLAKVRVRLKNYKESVKTMEKVLNED